MHSANVRDMDSKILCMHCTPHGVGATLPSQAYPTRFGYLLIYRDAKRQASAFLFPDTDIAGMVQNVMTPKQDFTCSSASD
jgi:hypothetical protein